VNGVSEQVEMMAWMKSDKLGFFEVIGLYSPRGGNGLFEYINREWNRTLTNII